MKRERNLKVYFPNLNGLRFIAACFVIINHVEQLKVFYQIDNNLLFPFVKIIGKLGVMLFFVLSGFLITYLLLYEEQTFGKIHTKKFYFRRFLRIVPLYFFVIIIVYFVLQNFSFWQIPHMPNPIESNFYTTLVLHVVFLPNLITAIFGFLPYIAQAWSIGTEEQSYLLWPILLKRFAKNRVRLMIGIIVFYFIVKIIILIPVPSILHKQILLKFWYHFNIDSIAIGGLFAVLLFQRNKVVKFLLNTKMFYAITSITVAMMFTGIQVPYFHYQTYSIIFGYIILNLAANNSLKNVLEWKLMNYLGQISYGIYMYHFMILIPVLMLVVQFDLKTNWVIYPLVLVGTFVMSLISYEFFEKRFLKLKSRYTLVESGNYKFQ